METTPNNLLILSPIYLSKHHHPFTGGLASRQEAAVEAAAVVLPRADQSNPNGGSSYFMG
jgi:hypothetical protein